MQDSANKLLKSNGDRKTEHLAHKIFVSKKGKIHI